MREMDEQKKERFQLLCKQYLLQYGIDDLRAYGRSLCLAYPTKLKKSQLIDEIVSVLCREKQAVRGTRGAPVRNNCFDVNIPIHIEKIRKKIFNEEQFPEMEQGEGFPKRELLGSNVPKMQEVTTLQFSVCVEQLNGEQKQKLMDFLSSL